MENTDFYSLSGFLSLKSAGALSWIVSTRRYWCVLNETIGSLDFFNCERDLTKERKNPIDRIPLSRSALSLNQCEDCVFIILSNGKEYHLQAENHEALMVWLVGLQRRRDSTGRSQSISDSVNFPSEVTADRKLSSSTICDACFSSLCVQCQKECSNDRTRSSSYSIGSSDSAFSDQNRSQRANSFQETFSTLKSELDSLINKENLFQTILKEKSENIRQLENCLVEFAEDPSKSEKLKKILDERCRTTNNELKYLHNEIVKLSRLIRDDEMKIDQLLKQFQSQENQRQRLQRDYLSLLRSILCSDDGRLIGGPKHYQRLKQMLNECRQRDPSLPTFDNLEKSGLYVDNFGFKHENVDEYDRMRYVCMKLISFYDLKTTQLDESSWRTLLNSYRTNGQNFVKKNFKNQLRKGLPNQFRSEFWHLVIEKNVADLRQAKGSNYFQNLCELLSKSDLNNKFEKQIALDLNRTMPNHLRFISKDSDGIRQLRQILRVFALHNPQIGYCQGMNFLVALSLLFVDVEDAFWLLVLICERYLTNYYHEDLIGAQVDQLVLKELLREKATDLCEHFENCQVDLTSITLNWFLAIYIDNVPFECLLRIWDCFLFEGPKVLFRLALAILIVNRENLLQRHDTISMIRSLKETTKYCLDIEQLFHVAFEDLKPFCHRRNLLLKQNFWRKIFIEKIQRRRFHDDDEQMIKNLLDCVVLLPRNRLWLAFGSDFQTSFYEVEIERTSMMKLDLRLSSRTFSMQCVDENFLLIGTLAGYLLGLTIEQKQILWSIDLHSCVHSLFSVVKTRFHQIYCGLANGNLAIVQVTKIKHDEPRESFCLSLNSSTAILQIYLYQDQLWCLTSEKMILLNEKTLDILSEIYFNDCYIDGSCQLSCHANDYIWILHRSKNNTLEAWHPVSHQLQTTICLNQIFDRLGKTKEQLALINDLSDQDDDTTSLINEIKITSFLISDEQLWIGTSTGILYVFDYEFHSKRSSPSDSGVSTMENESAGDTVDDRRPIYYYSTTTSTSIESCETSRSSFPQTDDESDDEERRIENRTKKSTERSSIGTIELNLSFKAKITDSPVKYLSRTNSLPLVISCSGQLGDDEIVCRWHRIGNTNQWTNDVIVELSSETMKPIRPRYACREYHQKGFKALSTS